MAIEKKLNEIDLLNELSSNTNIVCEQDGEWKRVNLKQGGETLGLVKNGGNVIIEEDGTMTAPESEQLTKQDIIDMGFQTENTTYDVGGDKLGLVKNGGNVTINQDGTMTAPESEQLTKQNIIDMGFQTENTTYDVGGDVLGLVKNGGNVTINPDGTMTAPEGFSPEATYEETDKYYFEGEETQLVLANYGITLPFEGITSAYKLKAEITKEQLAAITEIRLVSYENLDGFNVDTTQPLFESADGSVFGFGSLGVIIVGFTPGATLQVPLSETMILPIPVPSKGIFMVIPDENYNQFTNNYELYFTGGTITANKYTKIYNKYLITPIIEIPDEIGYRENRGIRMFNASETTEHGFAAGDNAKATARGAVAIGGDCVASGIDSIAMGLGSRALANYAISMGHFCVSKYPSSYSIGNGLIADAWCQHVTGCFNAEDAAHQYISIVGGGGSNDNRYNLKTLDYYGEVWYRGSITSNGADYAEYFEWLDGNTNSEDRIGLLVTLDGDKIRLANVGDEILGIISGTAAVLGDNYECEWNGKYLTDDFGRIIYDMVETFTDVVVGEDAETKEPIVEKKFVGVLPQPRINPEYNSELEYINRADRPEWDTVGMLGKLYVRDNGTCKVNGYATVGENGIATKSDVKTNMRVLSRVNENVIRVLLK